MSEDNQDQDNSKLEAVLAKNAELLGEVKKLKAQLLKSQEIKPEDYQAIVDELDATKAKLTDAEKQAKTFKTEAEKFKGLYDGEAAHTAKNLIDSSLTNALIEAKVDPKYMKAVKALIGGDAKVEVDGENRFAKIGDKALGEFVKEWSATDEAKHYLAAPVNSGGGAVGGQQQQATQTNVKAEEAKKAGNLTDFLKANIQT